MFELPSLVKGAITGCVLLLLFVLERWRPAVIKPREDPARLVRNIGLWGINVLASPWLVLPLTLLAAENTLQWRPDWLVGWFVLVLDLLLLDIWIYWWHRANHEIPLLWRFHRVHHFDRWLDVSSAVRFHFGEVWLSALARAVFIMLLGIEFLSVLVFEALILIAAGFHHSNLRLPAMFEYRLSKVLITPSIHWVHHHALRSDTDSNYGTLLSCWDRLFRSRSPNQRQPGMPIGLQGESVDKPFLSLLVEPLRR